MSNPSRLNASLSPWSIHDNVRTTSAKGDESPPVKDINFKDTDMGMTTTLTTRDLSDCARKRETRRHQGFKQGEWQGLREESTRFYLSRVPLRDWKWRRLAPARIGNDALSGQ